MPIAASELAFLCQSSEPLLVQRRGQLVDGPRARSRVAVGEEALFQPVEHPHVPSLDPRDLPATARATAAEGRVDVFATPVSLFDEAEFGLDSENVLDFLGKRASPGNLTPVLLTACLFYRR